MLIFIMFAIILVITGNLYYALEEIKELKAKIHRMSSRIHGKSPA